MLQYFLLQCSFWYIYHNWYLLFIPSLTIGCILNILFLTIFWNMNVVMHVVFVSKITSKKINCCLDSVESTEVPKGGLRKLKFPSPYVKLKSLLSDLVWNTFVIFWLMLLIISWIFRASSRRRYVQLLVVYLLLILNIWLFWWKFYQSVGL